MKPTKETPEETLVRSRSILARSYDHIDWNSFLMANHGNLNFLKETQLFEIYHTERLKIDAPSEEEIKSESYEYGGSEVEQRAFIAGMKSAIELLTKGK